MWSGPRNISTAMMRAFEARGDCAVVDEPFYAAYLAVSGSEHPMREAVLASQSSDPANVVATLQSVLPGGKTLQYQKQMTHHMVFPLDDHWLAGLRHAFLVREPRAMILSYLKKRDRVSPEDLGLRRQRELYSHIEALTGRAPPVIDAADVLHDPPGCLAALCAALEIDYRATMCEWPPGRRATDGVWAPHWYNAVENTTGFQSPAPVADAPLDAAAASVLDACTADYQFFLERRLR